MSAQGEEAVVDERKADKDYCEKESDNAYDTIAKNQEEYDKQLLTLSTGLLAVLVAFLKDVVHLDSAIDRPLLDFGLSGLGLTVLLVIASFQISIQAHEDLRKYYKSRYENGEVRDFESCWASAVRYTNFAAGSAFIAGVALAIGFIIVNLNHQSQGERRDGSYAYSGRSSSEGTERHHNGGAGFSREGPSQACPEGEFCNFEEQYVRHEE